MCMKPDIIAERFVRIHGLLSALETVASANAERENLNFAGLFALLGEVGRAAQDLEAELTICAQQHRAP
jgi:hypothetical protein